ncbi:MAG TPA: recombinase family protein [Phycisphaerales bacterium]|nr:recombinase family protein [Phycisphaerales bacterium]
MAKRLTPPAIRCAVYTRKSTEEGLAQEFNSLDAQRESGEAYIASQKNEGWVCLPDRYDDGGYTGGNMERPALQRLLADIQAGRVDCVVVYKVDRLSRSLLDFSKMMETFDRHKVSFVSVTQQFNTTHSMGRLTLNILLSFAQFEREIISERTRDKIAAARRKGKYAGGRPVLGYDVANTKLVVNETEARRVREIFALYLEAETLRRAVERMQAKGWTTKRWTTKEGRVVGGQPINRTALYAMLTNVLYIGKVAHHEDIYDGEHAAIIDKALWDKVQAKLQQNAVTGGSEVNNKHGALLKGLLRCCPCGKPMTHSFTAKGGTGGRCYRYYVCFTAHDRGHRHCPSGSLPAEQIERLVLERVRHLGRDGELVTMMLDLARQQDRERIDVLETERRALEREARFNAAETRQLGTRGKADDAAAARLAELGERASAIAARAAEIDAETAALQAGLITRDEATDAARGFEPLWRSLSTHEQARLVRLLVERVDYDGAEGQVSITFHPEAQRLVQEAAQ